MGKMAMYRCGECGYTKELVLGIGMMHPTISSEIKEAIAQGEFGPELKSAYEACELPAVYPEDKVYECPSCGYWDVYKDASIYEPVDVAAVKKEQFGIKTVEEWGGIPYMTGRDIESGAYRLVREYAPSCPHCGKDMHVSSVDTKKAAGAVSLKCPSCGSASGTLEVSGCWD